MLSQKRGMQLYKGIQASKPKYRICLVKSLNLLSCFPQQSRDPNIVFPRTALKCHMCDMTKFPNIKVSAQGSLLSVLVRLILCVCVCKYIYI